MHTNNTNGNNKIIYPDLSYQLTGLLFDIHNRLGRFCREKQYGDALDNLLIAKEIKFEREKSLPVEGIDDQDTNKADFIVADKILLELKSKPIITKGDYYQIQRYLQAGGYKLGFLVNFRNRYLKPIRIIRLGS